MKNKISIKKKENFILVYIIYLRVLFKFKFVFIHITYLHLYKHNTCIVCFKRIITNKATPFTAST